MKKNYKYFLVLFLVIAQLGIVISPVFAQEEDTEDSEEGNPDIIQGDNNILQNGAGVLAHTNCASLGALGLIFGKFNDIRDACLEASNSVIHPAEAFTDSVVDSTGNFLGKWIDDAADSLRSTFGDYLKYVLGRKSLISQGGESGGWLGVAYSIQNVFFFMAGWLVVGGVVWQAVRIIWNKSGQPIADLIRSVAIFVLVSFTGITFVQLASLASDNLSATFLGKWSNGLDAADIEIGVGLFNGGADLLELIWLLLLFLGLTAQIFVMLIKDIMVVLASGVLVIAASGQFFQFSRDWLDRIIGTLVGLLLYKPFVALTMNIGLTMMEGGDILGTMAGAACIFFAAFGASPIVKFFSHISYSGSIGSGASMGSGAIQSQSPMMDRPSGGMSKG